MDIIDIYLDTLSAEGIRTCTDCLMGLYQTSLSWSHRIVRVQPEVDLDTGEFHLAYKDPNLWSYSVLLLTPEEAWEYFTLGVQRAAAEPGVREFVFQFSWSSLGLERSPCPDARLAFSLVYQDKDQDGDSIGTISWMGRDPWAEDASQENCWGDIVIGEGQECGTQESVLREHRGAVDGAAALGTAVYDLRGRKVRSVPHGKSAGACVLQAQTGWVRSVGPTHHP